MSNVECPANDLELCALLDGELTENRAQRLRDHLAGCAACTTRMNHLEALAAQLRAPVPEALDPDFVSSVERRLAAAELPPTATHRRRRQVVVALSTLAVAGAAIMMVMVPRGRIGSEYAPRGVPSPWHARVFTSLAVVPGGATTPRPIAAGASLRPGDGIAVTARNGNPDLPVYLMVFAVDARDEVHWIVPAWSDPAQNPRSVLLPAGGTLPAPAGRTPEGPAPGKLQLMSLLSRTPLDVRSVEALLRARRSLAAADDRQLRTLEVKIVEADARATP